MTIKSFKTFIDTYCPEAVEKKPISTFTGKRLAIDGNNWFHKYMATAQKNIVMTSDLKEPRATVDHEIVVKRWITEIVKLMGKFLEIGITPLFVIDGPGRELKWETQGSRNEQKAKRQDKLNDLMEKMEQWLSEDDSHQVKNMPTKFLTEKRKWLNSLYRIEKGDLESLRDALYACGIPCLRAQHDAEELCSNLVRVGICAAVLSEDYDTLCFGTPYQIRRIETIREGGASGLTGKSAKGMPLDAICEVVNLNMLLSKVQWSLKTFIDYCILCGCDFQPGKVKGIKGIATKKAYKLFQKHCCLEDIIRELELSGIDTSILKHEACREIFAAKPPIELCLLEEDCPADDYDIENLQVGQATTIDEVQLRLDILDQYELRSEYTTFIKPRLEKIEKAENTKHPEIFEPVGISTSTDKPLLELNELLKAQPSARKISKK